MRDPSADWADTCADAWPDDWDIEPPDPRIHDLRGQGLTAWELHGITDITITGEDYL